MSDDLVWIPSVPLPLLGVGYVRCWFCDMKFRGRDRRHNYEIHYRREHETPNPDSKVGVSRDEARRIYEETA